MKISECSKCNFKTKEKHSSCPLCNGKMNKIEGDVTYNHNLPNRLNKVDRNVKISYFCYKCRNESFNKVCLNCNVTSYLSLEYNNKRAVINRIDNLDEVFSEEEVYEILKELTDEEKYYIYHNFAISYKFFYQRDNAKAIILFFMAFLIYYVAFNVTLNYLETSIIISYFANGFANGVFSIFTVLGIWYLLDASFVEYDNASPYVGITCGVIQIIYIGLALIYSINFKLTLILGFISIIISIILSFVITTIVRKIK